MKFTKRKSRKRPEDTLQIRVFEEVAKRGVPDALFWHVPNQVNRRGKAAMLQVVNLKRMGLKPGWPDINALRAGNFYALELKTLTGRTSEIQMQRRMEINEAGGFAAEAIGLDAALKCLESWGLIRGKVQ